MKKFLRKQHFLPGCFGSLLDVWASGMFCIKEEKGSGAVSEAHSWSASSDVRGSALIAQTRQQSQSRRSASAKDGVGGSECTCCSAS